MQGADVNADCGAGMCALHMTALRGGLTAKRPTVDDQHAGMP